MDKERYKLRKILEDLKKRRGRHTELVSVYIPKDYNIINVIQQLAQEQGTASNIKSKQTRKNVTDALEKIIQHLRIYKNTPKNGLAVFCGNISEKEGAQELELWAVEPQEPITIRLYRCDQTFVTEPLEKILAPKHSFGLIAIDNKTATLAILRGERYDILDKLTSGYSGKHRAGGQSHRRFERLIEEESHNFKKRIAEHVGNFFLQDIQNLEGFIIGGPGGTKMDFVEGDYLNHEIKKKIIGTKDITYTDESGIRELVNESKDLLSKVEETKHKEFMQRFMHILHKNPDMVAYGKENVMKALESGAVEVLLVSEKLDEEGIEKYSELAEHIGTRLEIISTDFEEGNQLSIAFGGVVAILRYKI